MRNNARWFHDGGREVQGTRTQCRDLSRGCERWRDERTRGIGQPSSGYLGPPAVMMGARAGWPSNWRPMTRKRRGEDASARLPVPGPGSLRLSTLGPNQGGLADTWAGAHAPSSLRAASTAAARLSQYPRLFRIPFPGHHHPATKTSSRAVLQSLPVLSICCIIGLFPLNLS